MYRVLFHGSDEQEYRLLKDDLPDCFQLSPVFDRRRLLERIEEGIHGIILRFSDPDYKDLSLVKTVSGAVGIAGVIVVVSGITPAQAVSCMRNGAYDCLVGPPNGEILASCLERMVKSTFSYHSENEKPFLSGNSRAIVSLRKRLAKLADISHPVLITGETGSGKELAAKTIHYKGNRRNEPYFAVNCSVYSDDLLGAELFGSYRGAFTGSTDRPGFFESSNGGTIFLDEIGELSPKGQCALLRIIEEGTIRRIGSVKSKRLDVRIIAATNRKIDESEDSGGFRRDLYYRLNQLKVNIPPLRKRKPDIPCLIDEYLRKIDPGRRWRIDPGAMAKLIRYPWPGNVRELQSVILNASLIANGGIIHARDLVFPK